MQPYEIAAHRHEERDTNPRNIMWFALSLILTILAVLVAMRWLFLSFPAPSSETAPPSSVLSSAGPAQSSPKLQVQAPLDLKGMREQEDATLNGYGWIDRQSGIVRIPINQAIDLLVQRGLPSRGQSASKSAGK